MRRVHVTRVNIVLLCWPVYAVIRLSVELLGEGRGGGEGEGRGGGEGEGRGGGVRGGGEGKGE